jgi:hypothetical protein
LKTAVGFAVFTAALAGCAVIDRHERVPGWPELKIVEHQVATQEMRDRCARFVPPYQFTEGCTIFHFDRGEAHIYVSKDYPSRLVLEHERWHAAGYDHVGSASMRRLLEAWQATRPSGI